MRGSEVQAELARQAAAQGQGIEEFRYPVIGGVNAVAGDVVPDIVKIEGGIGANDIAAHTPVFRRASDLLRNLARASAGSTCLAAVERIQPAAKFLIEFGELGGAGLIVLFEEPERLSDDFASRIIAAGIHLGADEFLQFGSEGNIHGRSSFQAH